MKILVVDDEQLLVKGIRFNLENEGYTVTTAENGQQAVDLARQQNFDLIILDVMMPVKSGIEACTEIRTFSDVPVIMLTARSEDSDKLAGFACGADDYVTKPFSPREVLARVKAVLRRMHEMKEQTGTSVIRVNNLEINMNAFSVTLNDKEVPCTPKEIEILWTLASNPGMVFSREHLLESIWGYDFLGDTRAVDSHIKRIRAKLCKETNGWDIKTVWGVGYRFETGDA